jgi:hypothetical protein
MQTHMHVPVLMHMHTHMHMIKLQELRAGHGTPDYTNHTAPIVTT